MPAFSLFLGGLVLAAFWISGRTGEGLRGFAVMAILAVVFIAGSRSETLRALAGPGSDERWESIDIRATAFSGVVLVLVVLGSWLYEIANGGDGSPYGQLAAIGGLAYLVAIAWLRWRS